jgi:hypothetical protein
MSSFGVGFTGTHAGIYMNIYDITPTDSLSKDDINEMIHILRTQLLEPLQADCEDFRFRSTMYDLQDMFGEAATVSLSELMTHSTVEMAIRTLAYDSQDIIFRAQHNGEQQDNHIRLGEEGSVTRLEQLLENIGII